MLGAIVEAVVHCRDVDSSTNFHSAAFGLDVLQREGDEVLMGVAGSATGRLRLVPAGHGVPAADDPQLWDIGPRLLGIYSRDLDETIAKVSAAGGSALPIASYPYAGATMREVVVNGSDALFWTIPEVGTAHRPSTALSGDAVRLTGELHSAVLVPSDHDSALALFTAGGLVTAFDGVFTGEPFVTMTGMPPDGSLRLSFLTCADQSPARLELMSFTGVDARDRTEDPVGLRLLVFACDDPAGTRSILLANGATPLTADTVSGPDGLQIRLIGSESVRP